ncbi:hypothetical protein [Lacinutrix chionoecetis]
MNNDKSLNLNDDFKVISTKLIQALGNVEKFGARKNYSLDIDCSQLKNWNEIDIKNSKEFAKDFEEISDLIGPILYWFEIVSDTTNDTCLNAISEYKRMKNSRSMPSIRKSLFKESKALYLGMTKSKFSKCIVQHLGYNSKIDAQGLQLFHWAKPLNLKLRLHAYLFDIDMEDLVSIIELKLSRKLRPITSENF